MWGRNDSKKDLKKKVMIWVDVRPKRMKRTSVLFWFYKPSWNTLRTASAWRSMTRLEQPVKMRGGWLQAVRSAPLHMGKHVPASACHGLSNPSSCWPSRISYRWLFDGPSWLSCLCKRDAVRHTALQTSVSYHTSCDRQ